jgi:hypothetical protein
MTSTTKTSKKLSDAEYREWASNLVGKDWEIYWQEDEEDDKNEDDDKIDTDDNKEQERQQETTTSSSTSSSPTATASGQETAEEEKKKKERTATNAVEMEIEVPSNESMTIEGDKENQTESKEKKKEEADTNNSVEKEKDDEDDNESEGSIIDDWYDGHVLGVIDTTTTTSSPGDNGWKFRVNFVGDEEIYNICIVPGKIRPSARGWVQRTVALLKPPPAAGENQNNNTDNKWDDEYESKLPPDTSTLNDKEMLQTLKSKIITTNLSMENDGAVSMMERGLHGEKTSNDNNNNNNNKQLAVVALPTYNDFRRIQLLRYLLESQILLREKLPKIENHENIFTDGIRNPTENYVNYLIICCKDLSQACSWYCKSWKLLFHYFSSNSHVASVGGGVDSSSSNNNDNRSSAPTCNKIINEEEEELQLDRLKFKGLISEYLEFGKDTIINTAMIDVNASAPSTKRRQAISPITGSTRRTKRRRKQLTSEEDNDGIGEILTAASNLDTDVMSTSFVDVFVKAVSENKQYRHIGSLGNMLQSLSHLVVYPLVSWKSQAGRILGNKEDATLISSSNNSNIDKKIPKEDEENGNSIGKSEVKMDDDEVSSEEEDEEIDEMFTYEEIQTCLSAIRNNRVLSRFNLFDDVHKLHAKLRDIETNQSNALELVKRLGLETSEGDKQQDDEVLSGLTAILNEMNSSKSSLYNVDSLGSTQTHNGTAPLIITRDDLSNAIELRAWFVDVKHARSVRERQIFVRRLISKIESNSLPDPKNIPVIANLPQISQQRDGSIQNVIELQTALKNYNDIIEKRENDFLASSVQITNSSDRKSHLNFLRSTLAQLKECPVILPLEEQVATRIDVIEWYEEASAILFRLKSSKENAASFVDVKNQYESLQIVLRGLSSTRTKLIEGVESNDKADEEICKFVLSDMNHLCEATANEVRRLFDLASLWKERADSIISCLRMHGNLNAGEALCTLKPPAMVDVKRIADLTEEYPGLQIQIPGYIEQLQNVQSEAYEWSQNIYNTLLESDHVSFTNSLSFIEKERDHRPKGIIVDPNRSIVDSIVDLLSWYEKVRSTIVLVSGELKHRSVQGDASTIAAAYSSLIIGKIYNILADGTEALEIYCGAYKTSNGITGKFKAKSDQSLTILDKKFHLRKTSRALSREKIDSSELMNSLFSRLYSKDKSEGFPFHVILWFNWHLVVADLISQLDDGKNLNLPQDQVLVPSLVRAKQLKAQEPLFPDDTNLSDAIDTRSFIQTKSSELLDFDRIIEEAQNEEVCIKNALSKAKDLLRGSFEKAEHIREHLSKLKELLAMTKDRSLGKGGLALNVIFESHLDQHIRYFGWLVKTLQYPVLHEAEASYSSSTNEDEIGSSRIPWDALTHIHDRIPNELSGCRESTLCIMRVKELYRAAKRWQDEISRTTMISNRGNKRRGAIASYQENLGQDDTEDAEKDEKLRMEKMELLAKDWVLSKVVMPRQKAVNSMIDTSRKFEVQLQNFLAQDFDGNQDNAPLPKGGSLVGPNGQFILYRLTGSSLFSMMQTSVQSLSEVGDKVFAETPGKATFDWMRSAVAWIERLHSAVITQSNFTHTNEKLLVIPAIDAKQLCESGESVFLQTSDDMRQTLSNHGIYVSTNSVKKRLKVTLKKDGAHHSVGGIIIRWCPILFDALRADVAKLESWESGLRKIIDEFNAFVATAQTQVKNDEDTLFQWYCFRVKVQSALEEGQNSLVVSPTKEVVDSFTNLLNVITNYLDKNCSHELNELFSKRLFSLTASLYDDRFVLLDALLYRRESAGNPIDADVDYTTSFPALEPETNFRDTCRSNLERAFLKAAAVLNLESGEDSGIEDLSALKAWEIENEMFERFQDDFGTTRVSEEYREKARSLKCNLENRNNLSLCLNVLTSDIKADALVMMTPDQLASQKAKAEREKAKKAALKDTVLTPGVEDAVVISMTCDNHSPSNLKPKPPGADHIAGILKPSSVLPVLNQGGIVDLEVRSDEKSNDEVSEEIDMDMEADGAPTLDSDDEEPVESSPKISSISPESSTIKTAPGHISSPPSTLSASSSEETYPKQTDRSPPPPPPPSLANSFDTSVKDDDGDSSSLDSNPQNAGNRGTRINNAFGGETFRIEIHGRVKYAFSAAFYQEDESQTSVERYMSESLTQKGRSKIEDFNRFVSEKLRGGRWQATCLRLTTISDNDTGVYKAFYKEFETKERIAMFKLYGESGGKLFLVTPKFHEIAKETRLINFANKGSTYAIVLTKKDDGNIWKD